MSAAAIAAAATQNSNCRRKQNKDLFLLLEVCTLHELSECKMRINSRMLHGKELPMSSVCMRARERAKQTQRRNNNNIFYFGNGCELQSNLNANMWTWFRFGLAQQESGCFLLYCLITAHTVAQHYFFLNYRVCAIALPRTHTWSSTSKRDEQKKNKIKWEKNTSKKRNRVNKGII